MIPNKTSASPTWIHSFSFLISERWIHCWWRCPQSQTHSHALLLSHITHLLHGRCVDVEKSCGCVSWINRWVMPDWSSRCMTDANGWQHTNNSCGTTDQHQSSIECWGTRRWWWILLSDPQHSPVVSYTVEKVNEWRTNVEASSSFLAPMKSSLILEPWGRNCRWTLLTQLTDRF